ncbi:site-specific integrase [Nocardia neocaledoniensis]|uniref:site-specific integrase n=1 Tax=Nocardia neocaledoniensis TaxID=236511 RepID=UPI002453F423|nr:site-specific integrase [Nocardia neocaledoniensis]
MREAAKPCGSTYATRWADSGRSGTVPTWAAREVRSAIPAVFVGPRGGRIATGVLRDATHWDEVVGKLGYEHLCRQDLRHTGLTWMADSGVSLHVLQEIAGHADSRTTELYLPSGSAGSHRCRRQVSSHIRSRSGPALRVGGA